ncbi:hypothetical protein [Paractinoplanes toevensis]|uniref:Uncharacterized protein n=1 Tax=Paractinoplanes toevensis TaxID=571911 RepID=A0A919THA6_9ACTN|nr:hypothetical protein [Actinoplanes toevensis]GIM95398.1 hypothetical protein Ato02nite_071910 [Actinoplanes toevensis]
MARQWWLHRLVELSCLDTLVVTVVADPEWRLDLDRLRPALWAELIGIAGNAHGEG